ncbi:MAG: CAP domain-containing protein [Turicibacter sp.]|nr:CAP domain-containing protein [Turicibacter sp.]
MKKRSFIVLLTTIMVVSHLVAPVVVTNAAENFVTEMAAQAYLSSPSEVAALSYLNRERMQAGLTPLAMHLDLARGAQIRSEELATLHNHTRPCGDTWLSIFSEVGIGSERGWSGATMSRGQGVPQILVDNWVNNTQNRNLLFNSQANFVGIGNHVTSASRFVNYWSVLLMTGPQISNIHVSHAAYTIPLGGQIEDADALVWLELANGTAAFAPVITEMISGLDPDTPGRQQVTVHYRDFSADLIVQVGGRVRATIEGGNGGGLFSAGAVVPVNAIVPIGYRFVRWTGPASVNFANANQMNTTFVMPQTSVTITAEFERLPLTQGWALPQSNITLPNRRLTEAERADWVSEYWDMGGLFDFEIETMRLVNVERVRHGLVPLQFDHSLAMAARFYSQTMANLNTNLGHNEGPYRVEGATSGASANIARAFGGNLIWSGGSGAAGHRTPEMLVQAWLSSDAHRAHLLAPAHRYMGAGSHVGGRWGGFHYLFLSVNPSTHLSELPPAPTPEPTTPMPTLPVEPTMPTTPMPTPPPTEPTAAPTQPPTEPTSEPTNTAIMNSTVALRSGPGAGYARRGNVDAGTVVTLLETSENGSWTYIQVGDQTGWVRSIRFSEI